MATSSHEPMAPERTRIIYICFRISHNPSRRLIFCTEMQAAMRNLLSYRGTACNMNMRMMRKLTKMCLAKSRRMVSA